jgi:hypothetical protein
MNPFILRCYFISLTIVFLCAAHTGHAQISDMTIFQSNMRSKAISKYYDEEFQRIGAFKVKGNSYLLKGANITDLFSTLGFGTNLPIVYDSYTQQVSILLENKTDIVNLSMDELDSFFVKVDNDNRFTQPALFINASKIDASKKFYLQQLTSGSQFNLYKLFKAEMRPAAMDIAQTNVKEFEIVSEYYYLDMKLKGSFVKIKPNTKSLKEDFKEQTAALDLLNSSSGKVLEDRLILFFDKINS